jgi:23S rRNA (guanosine2251-2'-O)-methyltransferase
MFTEIITRRNPVLETLRGNRRNLIALWLQEDLSKKIRTPLVSMAKSRNVPIHSATKQTIGSKAQDSRHQGVLIEVGPYQYSGIDEILSLAASRGEPPFLLLLDLLHGPQNIGTLLRTAEICGVHGIVIQDRRAPDITPAVVQYSAGASEHLLIAKVTNLVKCIKQLQNEDVWVVGLDLDNSARQMGEFDLNLPIAIVVGHEGNGLRRLVRQECDILLQLPMRGHVESLNAAIAGSILIFESWQARGFAGALNNEAGQS